MEYEAHTSDNNKTHRSRKPISWFNPPSSKNVATMFGAKFLRIIDDLVHEALKQVLNRHAVKVSYRCTPNIKNHVDRHNAKLLNQDNNNINRDRCNCQVSKKKDCPLPGRCSAKDLVYVYKAALQRLDNNSEETLTKLSGHI